MEVTPSWRVLRWSEVGVKVSKRGGHMVTSQAFTPRNERLGSESLASS